MLDGFRHSQSTEDFDAGTTCVTGRFGGIVQITARYRWSSCGHDYVEFLLLEWVETVHGHQILHLQALLKLLVMKVEALAGHGVAELF